MKRNRYGSRVLITGATGGMGLSIAQAFAEAGFQVAGCSRHANEALPSSVRWYAMDVSDSDSVNHCVQAVLQDLGGIDILVHCAGMGLGGSVEDISAEELSFQLDINTLGFVRTAQAVLPAMRAQGRGLILPISSVAGFIAIPYQSSYSASKFALEALVQALRLETRSFGIRACLIEPGDTRTDSAARRLCKRITPCYKQPMTAAIYQMEQDEMHGKSPDSVAKAALKLVYKRKPPVRCLIGTNYRLIRFLFKCLPDRLVEYCLRKIYLGKPATEDICLQAK